MPPNCRSGADSSNWNAHDDFESTNFLPLQTANADVQNPIAPSCEAPPLDLQAFPFSPCSTIPRWWTPQRRQTRLFADAPTFPWLISQCALPTRLLEFLERAAAL